MLIDDYADFGKTLVTGGTGFIGAGLVKRLVDAGVSVRVFDNNSRGSLSRLGEYAERVEFVEGDICEFDQVHSATRGIDTVFHLAFVNGTQNFYDCPDKVLEVGVKGALNTLDAAMDLGVARYVTTSSSEVYQEPTHIPTTESERIIIPDIKNPRFSYSGGKIITELLALHYTIRSALKVIIVRPHNFYGPNMGYGHVIPQFIKRMLELRSTNPADSIEFRIQGTGEESRAFCHIDDALDGILLCSAKGENRELYHIGSENEITIRDLANEIADLLGLRIQISGDRLLEGSTTRRCPSIAKATALGYAPKISLLEGLRKTIEWHLALERT